MSPMPAERASEAAGKVVIYDSLRIDKVDTAPDQIFERLQNMMFTRIHHLPPTGTGDVEV